MEKDDVLALAKLARIELGDKEALELTGELGPILDYVGEVKSVSGASKKEDPALLNVMRGDASPHESRMYSEAILNNAPDREGNYIKVKKIL